MKQLYHTPRRKKRENVKKGTVRMDGPSRLSKKSSAFFGSLQNASLFVSFAVQKAAAVRRNGLLPQAFCRHSIQHEGTPAPSYSPCKTERFFSKQKLFDKLQEPEA